MAKKKNHAPSIYTVNPHAMENIPAPRGSKAKDKRSTYKDQKKTK